MNINDKLHAAEGFVALHWKTWWFGLGVGIVVGFVLAHIL